MQINNITLIADKCRKPCKTTSFKGNNFEADNNGKKRYKHYEEMSNDAIIARTIIKAHQNAQSGKKMQLYKAIPAIATGIVGTSLALTQPGKLSAKAALGLGFLATVAGVNAIKDLASTEDSEKRKKSYTTLGGLALAGTGALLAAKNTGKVGSFIAKEANQLSKEINATKLAQLSNKYVEPFIQKHPKCEFIAPLLTTISTSFLGSLASIGLLKGISKDIKKDACDNFERAKAIQYIARKDFDKIDAIEV